MIVSEAARVQSATRLIRQAPSRGPALQDSREAGPHFWTRETEMIATINIVLTQTDLMRLRISFI